MVKHLSKWFFINPMHHLLQQRRLEFWQASSNLTFQCFFGFIVNESGINSHRGELIHFRVRVSKSALG